LALIDAFFLAIFMGVSYCFTQRFYVKTLESVDRHNQYAGYLLDSLNHLAFIKRTGIQSSILKRCFQAKGLYWKFFLQTEWLQNYFEWFLLLIRKLNILVLVGLGLYLIFKQQLSIGAFIAFLTLKNQLIGRLDLLMKRILQWQYLKAPLDKLAEIFKPSSVQMKAHVQFSLAITKYHIEIIHPKIRTICYPSQLFEWGKHYWIYGPSASGKTTFLMGLSGVLPLCEGEIRYGGQNDQQSFARDLVFVMQNDGLFKASVVDNITLFSNKVDIEYLEQIMNLLGLQEFCHRLTVLVGPDGYQLSAGQIQRVLLARALYRKPKWLILDEATCHLDLDAEQELIKSIMTLPLSIIMVNHREDCAQWFDAKIELRGRKD
jgi:ATP-binding cassette subfamily B protein RaxB